MSDRLKALREQQAKIVADARAKLDEITNDTPEPRAKEIEAEYDKMMADYDKLDERAKSEEAREERKRKLEEREAELEAVDTSRRPGNGSARTVAGGNGGGQQLDDEGKRKAYRAAFHNYLRYGTEALQPEERKLITARRDEIRALLGESEARAQGVASAGIGGALVPEGFMADLIKSLKFFGPMNDGSVVRRLETGTGASMPWPTVDDTTNKGALIAENTQVTEQTVTFSTRTLDAYKYTSRLILVANELLQDSAIDVEQVVRDLMAERIGRILNEHFTTGSGSSQPNGVVTASTLGVTAASSTAITADELIDLEHQVDLAYRNDPSCRFMFHDLTFKAIRKLKDADNRYLWQPSDLRAGAPATLLGYPFSINNDMIAAEQGSPTGDGSRTVLFGAFNRYVVRQVLMFAVRRLVERYADYDQIGFIGFTRGDGELLDTAAIKHIAMA